MTQRPHAGYSRSQRSFRLRHCVQATVRRRLFRTRCSGTSWWTSAIVNRVKKKACQPCSNRYDRPLFAGRRASLPLQSLCRGAEPLPYRIIRNKSACGGASPNRYPCPSTCVVRSRRLSSAISRIYSLHCRSRNECRVFRNRNPSKLSVNFFSCSIYTCCSNTAGLFSLLNCSCGI